MRSSQPHAARCAGRSVALILPLQLIRSRAGVKRSARVDAEQGDRNRHRNIDKRFDDGKILLVTR